MYADTYDFLIKHVEDVVKEILDKGYNKIPQNYIRRYSKAFDEYVWHLYRGSCTRFLSGTSVLYMLLIMVGHLNMN